jgi:hypothetical protein
LTSELYVESDSKKQIANQKKILSVALRLVSKLKAYHLKALQDEAKGV